MKLCLSAYATEFAKISQVYGRQSGSQLNENFWLPKLLSLTQYHRFININCHQGSNKKWSNFLFVLNLTEKSRLSSLIIATHQWCRLLGLQNPRFNISKPFSWQQNIVRCETTTQLDIQLKGGETNSWNYNIFPERVTPSGLEFSPWQVKLTGVSQSKIVEYMVHRDGFNRFTNRFVFRVCCKQNKSKTYNNTSRKS